MFEFRKATLLEAELVAALVNSAYRGESSKQGWTTEAELLEGLRTTMEDVKKLIVSSDDSFILLCLKEAQIVGSVHVEKRDEQAHIGMFVVAPVLQGNGIGKQLLAAAERTAQQVWAVSSFVMAVITLRHELIAFYRRRGYQRTGVLQDFPYNPALWTPKVEGLQFELLEKLI
jgi:GNAT superfamily N-acetyltransferase